MLFTKKRQAKLDALRKKIFLALDDKNDVKTLLLTKF